MATKVYIDVAGCKRRQLDIQTLRNYLEINGHTLVENPEDADRIVVSTCAFKQKEEDESVNRLRFFRKFGRDILVLGCLPDIAGERYREFADFHKVAPREIAHVDRYFEHDTVKFAQVAEANLMRRNSVDIVKSLKRKLQSGALFNRDFFAETAHAGVNRLKELMCAPEESWFLFVCRGCHGKCSYCAIRRSIGPVKSKPIARVVEEMQAGLQAGYRDFSILGDDPGCYGLDNRESFPQLLDALVEALPAAAAATPGIRFHIKEIHPKFLIGYATDLIGRPGFRLVRSMLCPVQSGSDRILQLMQREHTAGGLRQVLQQTRCAHPQMTLDTQIIVGFPSESDDDFHATLEMVRTSGFNTVVVFPYHDKEGTEASGIGEKVSQAVIRKRMGNAFSYFRRHGVKPYYSCP